MMRSRLKTKAQSRAKRNLILQIQPTSQALIPMPNKQEIGRKDQPHQRESQELPVQQASHTPEPEFSIPRTREREGQSITKKSQRKISKEIIPKAISIPAKDMGNFFSSNQSSNPKKGGAAKGSWNKKPEGKNDPDQKEEEEVQEVVQVEEEDHSMTLEEYYKSKGVAKPGVEEKAAKKERTIVGGSKVEGFEVLQTKEFTKVSDNEPKKAAKQTTSTVPQPGANAKLLNFQEYSKPDYSKKGGDKGKKKGAALEIKEEDFPSL